MIYRCLAITILTAIVMGIFGCRASQIQNTSESNLPPSVPIEFRAAWIASVANINWPSRPGLTPDVQRQEAIELINKLDSLNFNAVILQVRPQCDALYSSNLEPWSYYLTGEVGMAPDPYYDPLQFWIDQCRERGLELHAWLNPYRAHHTAGGDVSSHSIANKSRHLVHRLDNGMWWMDPSLQATQDHSYAVVMDLVRRYDLDGIHFDDYFYPYPSYNAGKDFPDSLSYRNYLHDGGSLSVGDFRREAVNKFIRRVYQGIKSEKKHIKFGISPFGIWRPGHPESIQGFDQYDQLYADAKLWLEKGWVDYFTPQLYWPVNQIAQSYPILLRWWMQQNKKQIPVWPGMSIGRKKGAAGADEVVNQIMIARALSPDQRAGTVHWSIAPLMSNDTLAHSLRATAYREKALVPAMRHLSKKRPATPILTANVEADATVFSWQSKTDCSAFVVQSNYGKKTSAMILPGNTTRLKMPSKDSLGKELIAFELWAIDRFGGVSKPVGWTRRR